MMGEETMDLRAFNKRNVLMRVRKCGVTPFLLTPSLGTAA